MISILVVSEDSEVSNLIHNCFPRNESRIATTSNKETAIKILRKKRSDLLFIDIDILKESNSENDYKKLFEPFWLLYPTIEIIVMSTRDAIREAVMAVKAGASNYVTYPINPDEVKHVTETIYQSVTMQSELDYLRDQFWNQDSLILVQTKSLKMKNLLDKIRSVAPTRSTVLLIGETGTGKGELARLIHKHSNRREGPFISVHCGAIPETLLESELFGHEKGSFTGAFRRKLGKFEIARGGTIFLDEVGTITPTAQIKLLQILQEKTFQRVGGEETIEADARIIAATNSDLKKMCEEGKFRKDLYYRLNVFPIEVLPLRERIEDIPHLVEVFLEKMNRFNTKAIHGIDFQALQALKNYTWPGNIRELENLVERAYILETSSVLRPDSFPAELFEAYTPLTTLPFDAHTTLSEARQRGVELIEKTYLKKILANNRGKIRESAREAGVSTRQIHKLMKKYGIQKETYKTLL